MDLNQRLSHRAKLLRQTRRFFDDRGFYEVQTPCLSADHVIDAHIDPVMVPGHSLGLPRDERRDQYFLQSSPEFAMKRLLGAGVGSIYSLGPVFRAGERSQRHNVEFTMLEWYDVGASMDQVIQQTMDLVEETLGKGRPRQVTYRQLFQQTLGFDPIDEPLETLMSHVERVDVHLAKSLDGKRDDLLDVLMTQAIEPKIESKMILIRNYPLSQAALARQSDDDPQTAERFELVAWGLELANGYGELLDGDELRKRNAINQAKRQEIGRFAVPENSRLLEAMDRGLPACSGVALGFDRLVMLALGTRDIQDVLTFPIESA